MVHAATCCRWAYSAPCRTPRNCTRSCRKPAFLRRSRRACMSAHLPAVRTPTPRAKNSTQWVWMGVCSSPHASNPETPMSRKIISTPDAPAAIGTYSQAVQVGNTVYMSGQIGLDPGTMQLVDGIDAQIVRVFENLKAVAEAAGGSLNDAVKFNIYLTDLANFGKVNEIMAKYLSQPYPARAAVGVASLPRGALVEADAVLHFS